MIRAILAVLLIPTLVGAAVEEWPDPELPVAVQVSLPENHDPAKKWPAVFFYHGTGGHPTTTMIRQHTGPRDWIVVGMAYTRPGPFTYTPENLKRELTVLRRVRDGLADKHGLDPARLYVSGFSMGGWMSGFLFQADRSLAGAVILGAGHITQISPKPAPYAAGTPVFLGVGRDDGNYPFALKARLFYGKLGASVTMETWPDQKHAFPAAGSVALREWFSLRNGGQPDEAALDAEFAALGRHVALDQWQALLEFRERPFVAASAAWKDRAAKRIAELEGDPVVTPEAKLFKRHRQILADEVNAVTLPDLQKVNAAYAALAQQAGGSAQAPRIEADHQRVAKLVASFEAQRAQREKEAPPPVIAPDLPKSDRTIPRNPLVR